MIETKHHRLTTSMVAWLRKTFTDADLHRTVTYSPAMLFSQDGDGCRRTDTFNSKEGYPRGDLSARWSINPTLAFCKALANLGGAVGVELNCLRSALLFVIFGPWSDCVVVEERRTRTF